MPRATRSRKLKEDTPKAKEPETVEETVEEVEVKRTRPRTPRRKSATETISTFLRIRPLEEGIEADEATLVKRDGELVEAQAPETSWAYKSGDTEPHEYRFTEIFDDDSDQAEVFRKTAASHVTRLFNGSSGMLVAYGSSGSGKTHTVLGDDEAPEAQGLAPRVMKRIFDKIACLTAEQNAPLSSEREAPKTPGGSKAPRKYLYFVFMTCLEVYNEHIYDLLAPDQPKEASDRKAMVLKYDLKGKPNVRGLTEIKPSSAEEAVQRLRYAYENRVSAATLVNENSSRSHCVVTVKLARVPANLSKEKLEENPAKYLRVSKFTLVDLAGNERGAKTQSTGDRQQEAGNINLSLMKLGRCIATLRSNQTSSRNPQVVPYRESKLTRLLQEYFEGEAETSIIICANPSPGSYDEVVGSLRFGLTAQDVTVGTPGNNRRQSRAASRASLYAPTAASKSRAASRTPRKKSMPRRQSAAREEGEDVQELRLKLQEAEERLADMERDIREEVSEELQEILGVMRMTYEQRIQQKLMEEEERFNRRLELLSGLHMPERQEEHLQSIPSSEELVEWCRKSSQGVNMPEMVQEESPEPAKKAAKRSKKQQVHEAVEEEGEMQLDDLHLTLQSSYEDLRENHCNLMAEYERVLAQLEVSREVDSQKQKQINQLRIQSSSAVMEREHLEERIADLEARLRHSTSHSTNEEAIEGGVDREDIVMAQQEQLKAVSELRQQLHEEQCNNQMLEGKVTELTELYRMLLKQQQQMQPVVSSSSNGSVKESSVGDASTALVTGQGASSTPQKVQSTLKKMLTPKRKLLTPRKRGRGETSGQTMVQEVDVVGGMTTTFKGKINPSLTGQGVSVQFTDVEMVESMKTADFIKQQTEAAAAAAGKGKKGKKGRSRKKKGATNVPNLMDMPSGGLGDSASSITSDVYGLVECATETNGSPNNSQLMSPITTAPMNDSMMAPMAEWSDEDLTDLNGSIGPDMYESFTNASFIELDQKENSGSAANSPQTGSFIVTKSPLAVMDSFEDVTLADDTIKSKRSKTTRKTGAKQGPKATHWRSRLRKR